MFLVQHPPYPLVSLTLKLDLSDLMKSNLLAFSFISMVVAWLEHGPLEEQNLESAAIILMVAHFPSRLF